MVRAKAEGSNADAFHIKEVIGDCGEYNVFLVHRKDGADLIWSVYGTRSLSLLVPLKNHTLLANNNAETNGGYKFVYYYWYKDGQLLQEGSHDELGGSYYTGGADLDVGAEYRVKVIDTEGKYHYSCLYRYLPQEITPQVKAYPNPVSRGMQVYVEVESGNETLLDNATVEIYNSLGQYLGKVKAEGRRITPVELPQRAGVYILKFKSNDLETNFKIIVN